MTDTLTILCAPLNKTLAKVWRADGNIEAAANATWFQAMQSPIGSVKDICRVLDINETKPRRAIVKEAIATGADMNRLRRTCQAGIDKFTRKPFVPGLAVVPRLWIVLDVEKVLRPTSIDFRDGARLAEYVRGLLPDPFNNVACAWQLSGRAGHPSYLDEIRLHAFFMLDTPVFPSAWELYLSGSKFVDPSGFNKAKLIFTAAPVIQHGSDPIAKRHGTLDGEPSVAAPKEVIDQSDRIAEGLGRIRTPGIAVAGKPMPDAAAAFVEIISKSNILRSHHGTYRNDRPRRLAFCAILKAGFGVVEEGALAHAFQAACVGDDDPNGEFDAQQAVAWARVPSPTDRAYSLHKLLCDASAGLHAAGAADIASRAARLAMALRGTQNSQTRSKGKAS